MERFFATLDLQSYAAKLKSSLPKGAKPIDREAILRGLLAAPIEGLSTFTRLHERLERDIRFLLSVRIAGECARPIRCYNLVFSAIVKQNLAEELFIDLVNQCKDAGIIDGTHLASTAQPLVPMSYHERGSAPCHILVG